MDSFPLYCFGGDLQLAIQPSDGYPISKKGWPWTKRPMGYAVSLYIDFPAFPTPDGKICVQDPKAIWKFVFGENPESSPLLQGVTFDYVSQGKNDNVWAGAIFYLVPKDFGSCSPSQVERASRAVYEYFEKRMDTIRDALEREYAQGPRGDMTERYDTHILLLKGQPAGVEVKNPKTGRRSRHFEPVPGRAGVDAYGNPISAKPSNTQLVSAQVLADRPRG